VDIVEDNHVTRIEALELLRIQKKIVAWGTDVPEASQEGVHLLVKLNPDNNSGSNWDRVFVIVKALCELPPFIGTISVECP